MTKTRRSLASHGTLDKDQGFPDQVFDGRLSTGFSNAGPATSSFISGTSSARRREAGNLPVEFPVTLQGDAPMTSTAMVLRSLLATTVKENVCTCGMSRTSAQWVIEEVRP